MQAAMQAAMQKVFVTRQIPEPGIRRLQEAAPEVETEIWPGEMPPPSDVLRGHASGANALLCLLTDRVDDALLSACPGLRVVSQMAVGYDNIDVDACTRRGIPVCNTPGVLTETSAELAFALLMATSRRIVEADRYCRSGAWQTWDPNLLLGRDLFGATLGVVGLGRIGLEVARRARAFQMRVLYTGPRRKLEQEAELAAEYRPLDALLAESDFVSLHLPLSADTRHLIGDRELRLMKRSAILINTARGPVLDQAALYRALVDGVILAAGLDVFEVEPVPGDEPLLALPNVVVLPHIASASVATRGRMAEMAAENLLAVLRRVPAPHTVNPQVYDRIRE